MVASTQLTLHSIEVLIDSVSEDSFHLHKILGETQFSFCVTKMSHLENAWVLTCWKVLCQKMQMLLVEEKCSKQLQRVWEDKLRENGWLMVAGKRVQEDCFQQICKTNLLVERCFFRKQFALIMSTIFGYQPSAAVSGNRAGIVTVVDDVLSSHEQNFVHLHHSMKTS